MSPRCVSSPTCLISMPCASPNATALSLLAAKTVTTAQLPFVSSSTPVSLSCTARPLLGCGKALFECSASSSIQISYLRKSMNEINESLYTHSYPAMPSRELHVFCSYINASAICKTSVHSEVGLREYCSQFSIYLRSLVFHIAWPSKTQG
jgi:hypothetical protein